MLHIISIWTQLKKNSLDEVLFKNFWKQLKKLFFPQSGINYSMIIIEIYDYWPSTYVSKMNYTSEMKCPNC